MRVQLRRTITLAVFAFTFMLALSICTYTAHANVEVYKDEVKKDEYITFQFAVEAVNKDANIKDGDSIKFIINDNNTYPGNAPAFDKRINVEITGETNASALGYYNDQTFNIKNAASVDIHDIQIYSNSLIEDSEKTSVVSMERVNSYRTLEIKDVGSVSIDGTKASDPDYKSRVQTLKIVGTWGDKITVPLIKGIEAIHNVEDGFSSDGYVIAYADCSEISNCNLNNSQIILQNTTVKKFCDSNVSYGRYETLYPDFAGKVALAIQNSQIDRMENCMIVAAYYYKIEGTAVAAGTTTLSMPDKAIGTMKDCILYGPELGLELRDSRSSVGTIDSCIIASKDIAIKAVAPSLLSAPASIGNIMGETVIFSRDNYPVKAEGTIAFESGLKAAVGTVRIGTVSGRSLFNGSNPALPSGFTWRNSNRDLSLLTTPDELGGYIRYDLTEFYYLSYDKCKIAYHEGAGEKKDGFDDFYQTEVVGGAKHIIKGFDDRYISVPDGSVDPDPVLNPMQWTSNPTGEGDPAIEGRAIVAEQKSYDFYPKFKEDTTYKVEFVTGDYATKIETQQVFNGIAPKKPDDPTHPGATFVDWYLDPEFTSYYGFYNRLDNTTYMDENRTVKLYAKWVLNDYTVTFNTLKNGGMREDQKTVTVKWGSKVDAPLTPPKYSEADVKHFSGWFKTAKGTTPFDFDTEIKANTTIYACFEYNESTITFDMDGGSVPDLNSPWKKNSEGDLVYKGLVDDEINYPWDQGYSSDKPRKEHYKYGGVYKDSTFTKPVSFEDRMFWVPTSRTYYVKFIPNNYDVLYYDVPYSEYKKDTSIAPIKKESLPYGSDVTYVPEEYADRFAGWNPYTYSYNSGFNHIDNWDGTVAGGEMRLFMKESPKIIFHSDIAGTKVMEQIYVREGESLAEYADIKAEQTDYNFVGWTTKPKTDGEYSYKETLPDNKKTEDEREEFPYVGFFDFSGSMPGGDINLYPVLVRDRLRVVLDPRGGTMGEGDDGRPQSLEFTVDINEKLRMQGLNSATKGGNELDGWYTQSGVKWNEDWGVTSEYCERGDDGMLVRTEEVGKNYFYYTVRLNAIWIPQEIAVEYNGGEHGTTDAPADTTKLDSTIILAGAATPENGYLFTGWADSKGGLHSADEEYLFDDWSLVTDEKLVFTAQYDEKPSGSFTISFDTAGGSYVAPVTLAAGEPVTPPDDPIRNGYEFAGWDPAVPENMPNEDKTCIAQWTKENCTISFNTAGGSTIDPITAAVGTPLTKPADPEKEHYVFSGWTPAFPDVMPSKDMALSAIWTPKEYTVTFDANGGTFEDGSAGFEFNGVYDSVVNAPPAPVREGYEFDGWDVEIGTHMPGENVTTKAIWTKSGSDKPDPSPSDDPAAEGSRHTIGTGTFEVISAKDMTVKFVKAKASKSSIKVPATVQIGEKTYAVTEIAANAFKGCKAKTVTIGAKVRVIRKGAFKGSKVKTLIVKTKKLTKKRVKGSLKGSKVKTVKVKVGKKKVNKKYVKKYKKIFTKKNAGKKVRVK